MEKRFDPGDLSLRGEEVFLRALREADVPALAAAAVGSREHYGFSPVPNGIEEARAYVARASRMRSTGQRYAFVIEWRGRVVGSTSYTDFQPWEWPAGSALQRSDRPDAVEIGHTWLSESAQRTRCNSEAKLLLMKHAFEVWAVHRVALRTDERNQRSRRAIERLGASCDGIRRADMPGRDGTVRNSAYYSIVSTEWPAVRDRLLVRLISAS